MKNKKIRLVSGKLFVEKEVPKYKLKKLSIGVVSVMVGTIICFGIQTTEVHAEETITNKVVVEEAQSEAEIKGEVQTELNRVSNGDFEGSQISNKTKWNLKPFGVSSIVTDDGNTYGKIAGETKDEYILSKVPTTPGRTYTVTADIKVVTRSATPSGGYFTARTFENNAYGTVLNQIELKDVMKNWTSQTFEFVAQGSETLIGIVKYNPEDTTIDTEKTEISIDNLKVVEKKQNSYKMIWEDEFNSTDLDKDTWSYMPGTVGRSEQQNYTTSKDNVYIENGLLNFKVTARQKEEVNPRKPKGRSIKYDSGFINTSGKKDFLYGRIEMKAKLPKGQGAFPAFWLMGTSYGWPGGGEIDIMELIGSPTKERLAA
ncbi:MAG: family 16 glycosylhydrolase, partial [Clostridium sp.]